MHSLTLRMVSILLSQWPGNNEQRSGAVSTQGNHCQQTSCSPTCSSRAYWRAWPQRRMSPRRTRAHARRPVFTAVVCGAACQGHNSRTCHHATPVLQLAARAMNGSHVPRSPFSMIELSGCQQQETVLPIAQSGGCQMLQMLELELSSL